MTEGHSLGDASCSGRAGTSCVTVTNIVKHRVVLDPFQALLLQEMVVGRHRNAFLFAYMNLQLSKITLQVLYFFLCF